MNVLNIWIFIWSVLAVFILGIFLWSIEVLFKQKKAWKDLSKKLKLNYKSTALLQSPIVEGYYGDYHVTLYSEEQPTNDSSRRQFRTVLLIGLAQGFPTGAAIATNGRREFVENLKIEEVHKPDVKGWNGSTIFHTQDDKTISAYMNKARYDSLSKLMGLKNKECIFIFDDTEMFYRMETPDPLTDVATIEKMIAKFTKECDVLRPNDADKKLYKKKKPEKAAKKEKATKKDAAKD